MRAAHVICDLCESHMLVGRHGLISGAALRTSESGEFVLEMDPNAGRAHLCFRCLDKLKELLECPVSIKPMDVSDV